MTTAPAPTRLTFTLSDVLHGKPGQTFGPILIRDWEYDGNDYGVACFRFSPEMDSRGRPVAHAVTLTCHCGYEARATHPTRQDRAGTTALHLFLSHAH